MKFMKSGLSSLLDSLSRSQDSISHCQFGKTKTLSRLFNPVNETCIGNVLPVNLHMLSVELVIKPNNFNIN